MVQIFVLSLKSSRDRRLVAQSQMDRYELDFEFFDGMGDSAEDASLLHRHYNAEMNQRCFKRPLSTVEGYCYLGHREIWRKLAQSGEHVALVLEDDFAFDADPTPLIEACNREHLRGVMIKLDSGDEIEGTTVGEIGPGTLVQRKVLSPRTTGYLIGADAARTLLERSERFFRPIDLDLKHYWEHKVPIYLLRPAIVSERQNCPSLISSGRKSMRPTSKLLRFWRNLKYQMEFRYGLLRNDCNESQHRFLSKSGKTG